MPVSREEIVARLADGVRELSGLDLAGADLSRLDLRGVDLSRADLSTADLRWAILEGADLSASVLRQADLRWAILKGANLAQADLRRANLAWSDLEGAEMLGADLDNAILDNANLGERSRARRARDPRAAGAGAPAAWSWREASPAALVMLGAAVLLVVMGWGWLYRRFYFDSFFAAGNTPTPADLVGFFQLPTLVAGLVDVVLRSAVAVVALPVLLVALALVVLAFLAVPLGLVYLGERMLGDVIRPAWRPVVVLGLFVAYFAVFIMAFPVAAFARDWVSTRGLPKGPVLGDLLQLWQVGGWPAQLGLLAVAAAVAYGLFVAWRLTARWLHTVEVPTAWRLRYPALNDALVRARASRVFARNEPLTELERRRGLLALAGGSLLLATLMTGVGKVSAYNDMCDGGRLARVQLYVGRSPAVADEQVCERLLATADGQHYVFFPNQTTQQVPSDVTTRVVNLQAVPAADVQMLTASGRANQCATCLNEPGRVTGDEVFVYDPSLLQTKGTVQVVDGPGVFTVQPVDPTMPAQVRLAAGGTVTVNGLPAGPDAIQVGRQVSALGSLADGGAALVAVRVNVVEGAPAGATPGAPGATPAAPVTFEADLSNPYTPVFSGTGWQPGSLVAIGLGRTGDTTIRMPLPGGTVTVGPDGSFSAPIQYDPQMPTGPDFISIAQDPAAGVTETSAWLMSPPAPTAVPATAPPRQTEEVPTPAPATATQAATNTPFPTRGPGGYVKPTDCDPDEFEFDNVRPFQKEVFVAFGDQAKGVGHNFCPKGDVDLSFFQVKQGRTYRVETRNLANGVDTVMAVGDLSNSTPCFPAGCWNDDAAALTFASRIEFTAVEDDTALVTVSNRGGKNGTDATYELMVVEFVGTPTPSPSPLPSDTPTASPTPTRTPRPFADRCERLVTGTLGNQDCNRACRGYPILGVDYEGAISRPDDEDWFIPVTLTTPGWYRVSLRAPENTEYTLVLREAVTPTQNNCPPLAGYQPIDSVDGNWGWLNFEVPPVTTQLVLQVTSLYADSYDAYAPYLLRLEYIGPGTPQPTSTMRPTDTPLPPTATATPRWGLPGPSATPAAAVAAPAGIAR